MNFPQPILRSLRTAQNRGLMPTDLGSEGLAKLGRGLWQQVFFSARTSNAQHVAKLKELVDRFIAGGRDSDRAQLKIEARAVLQSIGYEPLPEEQGTIKDLGSDVRLNLILDTQRELANGLTKKIIGESPEAQFSYPAWELVRVAARRVPRGSVNSGSIGWEARWIKAGAQLMEDERGQLRMIALKGAEVWAKLGDKGLFEDALNVEHPPFAFGSGMGWRAVSRQELEGFKVQGSRSKTEDWKTEDGRLESRNAEPQKLAQSLPKKLEPIAKQKLLAALKTMKGQKLDFKVLAQRLAANEAEHHSALLLAMVMKGAAA